METDMANQLLFFFSGLGVFNGLLMGLYFLFWIKPKRLQNQLFGLLLLMLTIRIGKSVFYYFLDDLPKLILQVGLSACVFIGPFLFFYLKSMLQPTIDHKKALQRHLYALLALTLLVGICFPYSSRPDLWNPLMVQFIYAVWMIYVVASAIQLKPLFRSFYKASKSYTIIEQWLLVVFFTNLLICMVFNTILYFGFPTYIFGPITFSFVFYLLAGGLIFHPKRSLVLHGIKQRYNNKRIDKEQELTLSASLAYVMEEQKLYRQSDLKLKQVAQAVDVSPHTLSQYLNEHLGTTFSNYVKEYRIQAACQLLQTNHQFSLEGIGYEVGFRSKSNFYASFKKLRGCTPSEYTKQLR
ncbi:MAG: helix-turn-helix transcriptional regulator [Bacteroidota bacterium]